MKKDIAILLPYKEKYTLKDAAAASIWVKDYLKISKLSEQTLVFGNLPEKKRPLTKNFINIDLDNDYDLILGSHNQNINIYNNEGNVYSPDYSQNVCIDIPYYGLNSKPFFYSKDNIIYSLI